MLASQPAGAAERDVQAGSACAVGTEKTDGTTGAKACNVKCPGVCVTGGATRCLGSERLNLRGWRLRLSLEERWQGQHVCLRGDSVSLILHPFRAPLRFFSRLVI